MIQALIGCAMLVACGTAPDPRTQQPPADPPAPAPAPAVVPEPAHPIVNWDNLVAAKHYPGAKLFPIRTPGVLEARGVVAVGHGQIDTYVPSRSDTVASTTTAKLGFEVSAAADTALGTAYDLLWLAAPARQEIVALDAMTLVERFALPAPKGTRVHRLGEAADTIWLDIVYPTGPTLVAIDPRTGRERWHIPKVLGALAAAGDRIIGGGLTAYDARSGAVAWRHPTDPEHDTNVVGETFIAIETKDETVVDVIATADGHAIGQGKLGHVEPYASWIIADDTLYASVVDGTSAPTRAHVVAWDPRAARPSWTALDRMSFVADGGLHTTLLATRRDLFFLDSENDTISAIDRATHALRWQRGFDVPASMVFANDGQAALYVESQAGVDVFRPSAAPAKREHVAIRGIVTFDQKPRANAWVRSSCGAEARTDAHGRFTLSCDAQGAVTVAVLVKATRAKGCNPDDARSETIVLDGKPSYEVELPTSSTCGD